MLEATPIPIYDDNYVWVFHQPDAKSAVVVDPGDFAPVAEYLKTHELDLDAILITHSHWDHVTGLSELVRHYPAPVYGPAGIDGIDHAVTEGDHLALQAADIEVWHLPGHMPEHLGYIARHDNSTQVFSGDTLFSSGCGRIFVGDHQQLYSSLRRLAQLPADTWVYPTHEYTLANLAFAKMVEPHSQSIDKRIEDVKAMRAKLRPSLPCQLKLERDVNPFLRCETAEVTETITRRLGHSPADPVAVFTELRRWKDKF